MVAINSKDEESYLAGRLATSPYTYFWIGASDSEVEMGWIWDDGSPFSYFNWAPGEPDNHRDMEDSVLLDKTTMQWSDKSGPDFGIGTICEMKVDDNSTADQVTTPTPQPGKFYGCEEGWVSHLNSCYLILEEKKAWLDAQTACRQRGAELTSISNHLENQFIWSQIPFGCQDKNSSCSELAQNGGCPENATFTNVNCRKSCGLCDSACGNLYATTSCDYWASVGECTKNPFWMWPNCALSCGCDRDANEGYWIGFNDRSSPMNFVWSDLSPVTYAHWMRQEPSHYQGKKEDCVLMHSATGEWSDEVCDTPSSGFVCEKPKSFMDQRTVDASALGCSFGSVGYTGKCFTKVSFAKTWPDAQAYCERLKGSLVILPDKKTNAFLTALLFGDKTDSKFWVGLSAAGKNYSWVDGLKPSFADWTANHTGKEQDMCVSLTPDGWATLSCDSSLYFVCEKPRRGWATTTTLTTNAVGVSDTSDTVDNSIPCPQGWTQLDGYCYKFTAARKRWIEAQEICEKQAGSLVTLHNKVTNDFVVRSVLPTRASVGDDEVWIGLQETVTSKGAAYTWADGTVFDFEYWGEGQPYTFTMVEVCAAVVKTTGKWKVSNCYEMKPFICQITRGGLYVPLSPDEENETDPPPLPPTDIPLCRNGSAAGGIDTSSNTTPVSNVKNAQSTADQASCNDRISMGGLIGVVISAVCACVVLVSTAFVYGKKKGSSWQQTRCEAASSDSSGFDNALYVANQREGENGGTHLSMDEVNGV